MSMDDGRPWEGGGDLPWDTPDGEWEPADSEAWRGDLHLGEWPENLAGPSTGSTRSSRAMSSRPPSGFVRGAGNLRPLLIFHRLNQSRSKRRRNSLSSRDIAPVDTS